MLNNKIKITNQDFFPNGDDLEVTDSKVVIDIQDLLDVTRDIVDFSSQEILDRLSNQPPLIDSIVAEAKHNNHAIPDVEQIASYIEIANRWIRKQKLSKMSCEVNPIDLNNDLID